LKEKKQNKMKVGKLRFEPETLAVEGVASNHCLHYTIHAVWLTNWPLYLNCVTTGVSLVTSNIFCFGFGFRVWTKPGMYQRVKNG